MKVYESGDGCENLKRRILVHYLTYEGYIYL